MNLKEAKAKIEELSKANDLLWQAERTALNRIAETHRFATEQNSARDLAEAKARDLEAKLAKSVSIAPLLSFLTTLKYGLGPLLVVLGILGAISAISALIAGTAFVLATPALWIKLTAGGVLFLAITYIVGYLNRYI